MVPADHQVRVIDAFVDGLDLAKLGFTKVEAEATGRPPYAPGDLLKLYIYGYMNQVRSSRRLEEAVEAECVTVVADTGYSNGEHGERCANDAITAIVPRAKTVNPAGEQFFSRDRFSYDSASDTWRCPPGETLTYHKVSYTEKKKEYWTTACGACALKAQCTQAAKRSIVRSFYEDVREAMHQREMADATWMKQRRELAEHPFGTMKWLMGHPRFLVRGLKKAKSELALGVFSYNLKRVISILGVPALLEALQPAPVREACADYR